MTSCSTERCPSCGQDHTIVACLPEDPGYQLPPDAERERLAAELHAARAEADRLREQVAAVEELCDESWKKNPVTSFVGFIDADQIRAALGSANPTVSGGQNEGSASPLPVPPVQDAAKG